MDEDRATILRLERVGMRYGNGGSGEDALRDVDLALAAGSFSFLVGPSGAGKTSLLRLMSLSHAPSRGTITLFGRDVSRLDRPALAELRRRVGVVFQDFRLLDHMSAFDNVALPLRIASTSEEEISTHVSEMLGWLGLSDLIEAKPPQLSMGQRQLVAVARAVIVRPSLLLADEPTSNVDAGRSRRLMRLFLALNEMGTAVVLATHSEDLLRRHRSFPVLRMEAGRLLPHGAEAEDEFEDGAAGGAFAAGPAAMVAAD